MFRIVPLFSGSSGNCTYIEYGDDEILVDAGVSCRMISDALCGIGTGMDRIKAVFVTHEHSDHIKGLETISKKYHIPIYINQTSAGYCDECGTLCEAGHCFEIKNAGECADVGEIHVKVFKTPHDAYGSVGYRFTFSDGAALGYATDIGYVTKGIAASLFGCETVLLESNHDVEMLKNGPYPYYLKKRILSDKGHLSNAASAAFLPYLYENGTKKVILAHLSEHNNTPRLAFETNTEAVRAAGIGAEEFKITVAMKSVI